jgi:hypothetical protein
MRAKRSLLLLSFSSLLVPALHAGAQVSVDAIGDGKHLYAGVEGSDFKPDYNPIGGRLYGYGFFADYMVSRYLGAEGEIRLLDLNKPSGQTQKNFFAGPIVDAYRYHRFTGYGKLMLGIDSINYPSGIGYGTYFAFAPGGGVEYRLNSRLKLRGEYEYQFVRSAPGFPNQPSNGLTPSGYSGGISYRIY